MEGKDEFSSQGTMSNATHRKTLFRIMVPTAPTVGVRQVVFFAVDGQINLPE